MMDLTWSGPTRLGNAISSITTGRPQSLYLDEKDHNLIAGKKVIILDDVISTGSTLEGMKQIVEESDTPRGSLYFCTGGRGTSCCGWQHRRPS